jgi:hypothetical protein
MEENEIMAKVDERNSQENGNMSYSLMEGKTKSSSTKPASVKGRCHANNQP